MSIIETTNFEFVDSSWRDRSNRGTDYHVNRTGPGGDWVYYDPFERRKVSHQVTLNQVITTISQPLEVPDGLETDED